MNSLYGTHMHPLIMAALASKGLMVELGAGEYSTPILHELSRFFKRTLITYENDREWLMRFTTFRNNYHQLFLIEDWDKVEPHECGLVLIDHAPAERRMVDIKRYADKAQILVVHDTEKTKFYGYDFSGFKYRFLYERMEKTTTLLSNFINVNRIKDW